MATWQEMKALSKKHFGWHSTHFSRKWEYPWAVKQIDDVDGRVILDAGAGQSPVALWLATQGACMITVDSNHQRGRGAGYIDYVGFGLGIVSYHLDFSYMPAIHDNSLDALMSLSVIEHITAAKRDKTWQEWARVLKPGGKLILTLDLIGRQDRLLNKCDHIKIEDNKAHGFLSDIEVELDSEGFVELKRETCPYKRARSTRELTTHVVGLVYESK